MKSEEFATAIGIMPVYIGERKNLRGAQRRTGNIAKTIRGYHFYDGKHWQLMDVPETIATKEIYAKPE